MVLLCGVVWVADFKMFQSLSTALFFFFLYFTDIYAVRSRAIIPLACMAIGMVLVVYLNVLFPFENPKKEGSIVEEGADGILPVEHDREEASSGGGSSSSSSSSRRSHPKNGDIRQR